MSVHQNIECRNCKSKNFSGIRYKCLVCTDFDLCDKCFPNDTGSCPHSHPMQGILTQEDFTLYYEGEKTSYEQPPSFVCPFCGELGFTEMLLQQHIKSDHDNDRSEVLCPICASPPFAETLVTENLLFHLNNDHIKSRNLQINPKDTCEGVESGVTKQQTASYFTIFSFSNFRSNCENQKDKGVFYNRKSLSCHERKQWDNLNEFSNICCFNRSNLKEISLNTLESKDQVRNEPLPEFKTTKNSTDSDLKQYLLTDELLKGFSTFKADSAFLIDKSLFVQELLVSLMNSSTKIYSKTQSSFCSKDKSSKLKLKTKNTFNEDSDSGDA